MPFNDWIPIYGGGGIAIESLCHATASWKHMKTVSCHCITPHHDSRHESTVYLVWQVRREKLTRNHRWVCNNYKMTLLVVSIGLDQGPAEKNRILTTVLRTNVLICIFLPWTPVLSTTNHSRAIWYILYPIYKKKYMLYFLCFFCWYQ